jgi:anti-sigma factor RsiW
MPHWTCGQVRDELDGWSLGALDTTEASAIERHLAVCADCREEASRIAAVAVMLPFAAPQVSPSAEAKRSLMARIADEQMAVAAAQSQLRSRPAAPPSSPDGSVGLSPRYHWSQLLIAPLAIALVVMTLWSFELRQQVGDADEPAGPASLTTAMLPDGVQTFAMQSDCEKCKSAGTLLADPEKADALMVAWDLDPSQVHQVWCEEGDGEKALVASLEVSDSGEVVQPLIFDQPIAGYTRIYVVNNNGEIVEINLKTEEHHLGSPTAVPTQRQ